MQTVHLGDLTFRTSSTQARLYLKRHLPAMTFRIVSEQSNKQFGPRTSSSFGFSRGVLSEAPQSHWQLSVAPSWQLTMLTAHS